MTPTATWETPPSRPAPRTTSTWLMRYNTCDADTADFSGDSVISSIDEVWFESLYQLQHPKANFTGDKHLDHHDKTAAVGTIRVEGKK